MRAGSSLFVLLCVSSLLLGCASQQQGSGEAVPTASAGTPTPVSAALPTASPQPPALADTVAPTAPAGTLALVNGVLIDGTGAEPVPDAVLVIQGDRIAAVGPGSRVTVPPGARTIDLGGATVLPGLINVHVHNTQNTALLKQWAQAGVTTVRDVGAPLGDPIFALRDSLRGSPEYARIVAAGPLVTVPDGYPIAINNFPSLAVTSTEDARTKVSGLLDEGAEVIKISLQPGAGGVLSLEEATAIVEVAHERGTIVAAHVVSERGAGTAIAAGVDDIEHAFRLSDDLIAQVVAKGMYWVPTFDVTSGGAASVKSFVEAGGQLAMGNDAGYLSGPQLGLPLLELIMLRDLAGLTPLQVLTAATRNGAYLCNLEQELGTLEAGKLADILVVNGDPLQDLKVLRDIRLVLHEGVVIRDEAP